MTVSYIPVSVIMHVQCEGQLIAVADKLVY
jgi:hypothetical protein